MAPQPTVNLIASPIVQYAIRVKWLTISIRGFNCSECLCNEMQLVCTPTVFLSSSSHFVYTIFPFLLRSAHIYIVLSSSTVSAFLSANGDSWSLLQFGASHFVRLVFHDLQRYFLFFVRICSSVAKKMSSLIALSKIYRKEQYITDVEKEEKLNSFWYLLKTNVITHFDHPYEKITYWIIATWSNFIWYRIYFDLIQVSLISSISEVAQSISNETHKVRMFRFTLIFGPQSKRSFKEKKHLHFACFETKSYARKSLGSWWLHGMERQIAN